MLEEGATTLEDGTGVTGDRGGRDFRLVDCFVAEREGAIDFKNLLSQPTAPLTSFCRK